jgi:hypothetical protein
MPSGARPTFAAAPRRAAARNALGGAGGCGFLVKTMALLFCERKRRNIAAYRHAPGSLSTLAAIGWRAACSPVPGWMKRSPDPDWSFAA